MTLITAIVVGVWLVLLHAHHQVVSDGSSPTSARSLDAYATSATCQSCHPAEFAKWAPSHHGLAERLLDPRLDKTAFDPPHPVDPVLPDESAKIQNGQYVVIARDLSNTPQPQIPRRVIGLDPLRQFLVDFPRGRLQTLEASYDPNHNQWFNVNGAEHRQPGDWGHWTGRGMTWNSMCAACHNTRLQKNYTQADDAYHTTMAEMSVGCEACHGPMKSHNDWQKLHAGTPAAKTPGADPTLHPLSLEQKTDTCASCHARRGDLTGDFVPGDSFFDHYSLIGVDDSETFYPDGQIREEDYEYSAFVGSKMHSAGVRCLDCHDPHSGKTLLSGNDLCMRCHNGAIPKAPKIDPALHTFHKPASTGSQCVNCHMPQTHYMQRHSRHDHGFTTPDPLLTQELNIPNACNKCHVDKTADWAVDAANRWYGAKLDRPARKRARTIAAARKGDASAKVDLLFRLADLNESAYWKGAYAELLGRWVADRDVTPKLLDATRDPSPLVRERAVMSLAPLAADGAVAPTLQSLLADPSRNVRIASAHALGPAAPNGSQAETEYRTCLDFGADQPTGQLQLAMNAAARGQVDSALDHLAKAVAWDGHSSALRREAAVLYGQLNRPADALTQINEACRLDPANAEYAYLAGLAAEAMHQPDRAIASLERTVKLNPRYARAWYNLGLARHEGGQDDLALAALSQSAMADPLDSDALYAAATILASAGRTSEARTAAEQALTRQPNDPRPAELLRNLAGPESK